MRGEGWLYREPQPGFLQDPAEHSAAVNPFESKEEGRRQLIAVSYKLRGLLGTTNAANMLRDMADAIERGTTPLI